MIRDEFDPLFKILASPCIKNEDEIRLKSDAYFMALKEFSWETFDAIVNREILNDDNLRVHLQSPAYYRHSCAQESDRKRQMMTGDEHPNRQEIQNGINFVNLLARANNEHGKIEGVDESISNIAGCFGKLAQEYYKRWGISQTTGGAK